MYKGLRQVSSGLCNTFTKNLFLTGESGVGKTTLLFRALRALGPEYGGFAVKRRIRHGRRESMWLVDLSSGAASPIATFDSRGRPSPLPAGFESRGVSSLVSAVEQKDLIVMDELGRFELAAPAFMSQVFQTLDSGKPVTGVIKMEANSFLDAVRARSDVTVIAVDRGNRESVAQTLLQFLRFHGLATEASFESVQFARTTCALTAYRQHET